MNQDLNTTVGDAFKFVRNGKSVKQEPNAGGIPITRIETIADGRVDGQRVGYAGLGVNGNERWLLQPGDILFSHINSVQHVGKCAIYEGRPEALLHGMNLLALRPGKHLHPRFGLYALRQPKFRTQLLQFVNKAVNQASVSTKNLKTLPFHLPPLDEQRRIATILDKADALRQKRKRAIALLDSLTQSIFLEMFGHAEESTRWSRTRLSEVATIDASMVDPKEPDFSGLLHYGPDRIEKDTGRLLPAKTAEQDGLVSGKYLCDASHILYSKIRPYLNKVALSESDCLCSADVYPVSAVASEIDRTFLWFILRSPSFLKYAESCSNRANIPKLNRSQFFAYETILPPLGLQKSFAERLQSVSAEQRSQAGQSEGNEALFASLQNRAFTGEL